MGKINKYANIYNKDGNIIRKLNNEGMLEDYTTEELEKLVDELGNDKESKMLFQYYQKYGNPHEKELIETLKKSRPIEEQKKQALKTVMDEYVDYEEVK